MYTRLFPGHTAFFLAHGHTANENENVPRFVSVMLGLRHSEGGEKTGRFALHHERKSQAFTISLSSFIFFSSKQSSSTGNDGRRRALVWRWCTPPRSDAPPRAPTAGCAAAAAHGLLLPFYSMCGGGGGARTRSSRRREAPAAPSVLSSRGWLEEAGKRSRRRGDIHDVRQDLCMLQTCVLRVSDVP
jgi:hypothetical protein